jgi:glutamate/tyrosine decarboxylase-like PLP-dependent enzyme
MAYDTGATGIGGLPRSTPKASCAAEESSSVALARDPARLELDPEALRAFAHRIIDYVVDHNLSLPQRPVVGIKDRAALERALREAPPRAPSDPGATLDRLLAEVIPYNILPNHPRHFAWIPNPSNVVSALADALAAGLSLCPALWLEASGITVLELVTVDWLRAICGLPEVAGGLFVSGGTAANLTALAVARHIKLAGDMTGARVYCSDQTHRSNHKCLRLMGFLPEQVVELESDERQRIVPGALAQAVAADRRAGRRPFCVIANAGTTNTGAVDPLDALARLCRGEDLWLHVDGAYGAAAALSPRGRERLRGLEEADSITIDPHKWLFQPVEHGCVLVRDFDWLRQTFADHQDYLRDTQRPENNRGAINPGDYGLQLTRASRAIKLWLSIQIFGLDAFAAAIERGFENAERLERLLRNSDPFEITTPAELGVVTFRYRGRVPADRLDAVNEAIVARVVADGRAMLSSTRLRGRTVLRMCTINPRTTEADLEFAFGLIERFGAEAERECLAGRAPW